MLQLETTLPVSLVVVLGLAILLVLSWLEWRRKFRFPMLRLVAVFVMVTSLTAYLLRPAFLTEGTSQEIILLTPRYLKTVVDSLHRAHPQYKIFAMQDAEPYANAERLKSDNEVLDLQGNIRFVVGEGVPEHILPDAATFIKGELPAGITQLTLPQRVVANRPYALTGLWNGKAATLVLYGPGGAEDSVRVADSQSFKLKFKSRHAGSYVYAIGIRTEERSWKEELPIEVQEPNPIRVLVWQQYPAAETRFLKNFLIEQGHHVVVRTQISKTNFRVEYGNHAQIPIGRITSDLLNEFDLLILANEANPSTAEGLIIDRALQEGLGVLWLPTESEFTKPPFDFVFTRIESDTAHVTMEEVLSVFPAWPFQMQENVIPVVANARRVLMGYKIQGTGKIGAMLLAETYPLLATGQKEVYGALWTRMLESVARSAINSTVIRLKEDFPVYRNEPITLNVISMLDAPTLWLDSTHVPLREHLVIDQYWNGTVWATETGWRQFLSPADSVVLNFFAFDVGAWQALRVANLHRLNEARLTSDTTQTMEVVNASYKPIDPIWFFLLFVLASGFLWLAPKL